MSAVYREDNFIGRVNFAAAYISAGRRSTRAFDTCFEMYDGDAVAVALVRRVESRPNTRLAENIWRYLGRNHALETAEKYKAIPTRDLSVLAARLREEAKAQNKRWMEEQRVKQESMK